MASQSMVRVCVFKRSGRKCYEAQWADPVTGKKKTRSTGETKKKAAERVAGKIEAELRDGRFKDPSRTTWAEFRERYESDVLCGKADGTAEKVDSVFNLFERFIDPKFLRLVGPDQVSEFVRKLRDGGRAESTIKSYLAHLKAALRWANRTQLLASVPTIEMPTRTNGMKGRPITTEEFERMLDKTVSVVGEKRGESWNDLLNGLWLSGLRRTEACNLHWTDDRLISVDFSGRRPMFRIQPDGQKSNKAEMLPMAPEFAEFLERIPESDRTGRVFEPISKLGTVAKPATVSRTICRIGKAAGIKVAESKTGKIKHASAHDLRRAFGFRWSMRVMPPVLKQLMRHESVQTTMEYYVGNNAEIAAEALWDAVSGRKSSGVANTFANTPVDSLKSEVSEST